MRYLSTLFAILVVCITIVGCGTIVQGTTQQVSFTSDPAGADVEVNGLDKGETPVTVELSRKDSHTVKFDLAGYQPYELAVNRKVSGWVVGNIVFGGLIGLAVDAATGGMYKLDPDQVRAQLDAEGTASVDGDTEMMYVTVVMKPDPSWEQIGTLTPTDN